MSVLLLVLSCFIHFIDLLIYWLWTSSFGALLWGGGLWINDFFIARHFDQKGLLISGKHLDFTSSFHVLYKPYDAFLSVNVKISVDLITLSFYSL